MANEVELEKVSKSVFGITSRRYRVMASEEVVPHVVRGKIDFVAAAKAIIEYYRKLAEASGSISLVDERTALTAIKKEREKLKLETERGNLVEKAWAMQILTMAVSEARTAFLGLPRRIAPVLAPKTDERDIEWDLREAIIGILRDLSKPFRKKK